MEVGIRKGEEFIKLGQALKKCGIAENGAFAKELILSGEVTVNGETELRRGKKLYPGDVIGFEDETVTVMMEDEG